MKSIHREDVPEYLRMGDWYKALDPDDQEMFEVPADCLKGDPNAHTKEELYFLLRSLQFWQVKAIPATMILGEVGVDASDDFPMFASSLQNFRTIQEASSKDRIPVALKTKHDVKMIEWLHEHTNCELSADACSAAAAAGDLESLVYLHECGCPWDENTIRESLMSGSIDCLEYAQANGCPALPTDENATDYAAASGHLSMLKYLRDAGEKLDIHIMEKAASSGSVACMQYLHEVGCYLGPFTTLHAARSSNSLACLRFAREIGCEWHFLTVVAAAKNGDLSSLMYVFEHGCNWREEVMLEAARINRLDIMQYAHERGCSWHYKTASSAFVCGSWRCLYYAVVHGANYTKIALLVGEVGSLLCCTSVLVYATYSIWCGERHLLFALFISSVTWLGSASAIMENILKHMNVEAELSAYVSPSNQERLRWVAVLLHQLAFAVMLYVLYLRNFYSEWLDGKAEA